MMQTNQTIGPEFESRMREVLHSEDLLLPEIDEEIYIECSRQNLENWLENKKVYETIGGVWLEHVDNEKLIELYQEVWEIHFTPAYVVSETVDGQTISREVEIYESQNDGKYSTLLAGLTGLVEYLALVEAGYLPKPNLIFGATNEEMAKFASRRLGFVMGEKTEHGLFPVVTDFDVLKSETRALIKKFGSKVINLGLIEMDS